MGYSQNDSELLGSKDLLIKEFGVLQTSVEPNIYVPEINEEIISSLDPIEAEIIHKSLLVVPTVAQIYTTYITDFDKYPDWDSFWAANSAQAEEISNILLTIADDIPEDSKFAFYREYFYALSRDWLNGRGRSNAESEGLWHALPSPRVDIRGLPKIEEGHDSYIHPHRPDGGDPTFTIRAKKDKHLPQSTVLVGKAGIKYLKAENVWSKFGVLVTEDILLAAGGLHGGTDGGRATGHQYRYIDQDGLVYIAIVSNVNIQAGNAQKLVEFSEAKFSDEYFKKIKWILESDSIDSLFGHEIVEALVEYLHPKTGELLKGREAIELYATIAALDGVAELSASDPIYGEIYEFMAISLFAKLSRVLSLAPNPKGLVYRRGYQLMMDRLTASEANVISYGSDGRVSGINIDNYKKVIHKLTLEIGDLIENPDKEKNDKLFVIGKAA